MQVTIDPGDIVTRGTDGRGRITLGSKYANRDEISVAIVDDPDGDKHEFTECPSCSGKLRYPTKADVECSDCGEVFYHEIRANGGHRLWGYNMAGELGEVADRAE